VRIASTRDAYASESVSLNHLLGCGQLWNCYVWQRLPNSIISWRCVFCLLLIF